MYERKEREREEGLISTVIEGEQLRREVKEYREEERKKEIEKKEGQIKMKEELDRLVKERR